MATSKEKTKKRSGFLKTKSGKVYRLVGEKNGLLVCEDCDPNLGQYLIEAKDVLKTYDDFARMLEDALKRV